MAELKQENLESIKETFLTESEVRALIANSLLNLKGQSGMIRAGE